MKIDRRGLLGAIAAGSAGMAAPRAFAAVRSGGQPALLARALASLDAHGRAILHRDRIGLVDFSLPSRIPRFDIVDLAGGRTIATHLVAHGRGSDPANTGWTGRLSARDVCCSRGNSGVLLRTIKDANVRGGEN